MKGTLLVVSAVTVLLYPGPDRWGLFEIQAFLDKVVREDMSPPGPVGGSHAQMGKLEASGHEFR